MTSVNVDKRGHDEGESKKKAQARSPGFQVGPTTTGETRIVLRLVARIARDAAAVHRRATNRQPPILCAK
jgi:hypothetical protein